MIIVHILYNCAFPLPPIYPRGGGFGIPVVEQKSLADRNGETEP